MTAQNIAVIFGSDSDWPVMEKCISQLREFDIEPHVEAMSAHRNPARVHEFATGAEKSGVEVIIAAAGMSNALAGAVAALTPLPVLGVPLNAGALQGLDALLSTVQMPPGIPVATFPVDGAKNAALFAVQILSRKDEALAAKYRAFKKKLSDQVAERNARLQDKMRS
ncbi:MAG: 5-(carboxyamino)imidazole ribonucleotide mutase [Planctomycetota bacterium]|jgi:5-(carboxyamino)imidazole ribonucleotide mutase